MEKWVDYFQILQVHFTADDEIIKSAYQKLSKRYHPDVNKAKNAEEHMKLLNHAYETLSNKQLKKHYMQRWLLHYQKDKSQVDDSKWSSDGIYFEPIQQVIESYLAAIQSKNYHEAYQMLSHYDKKNLFEEAFIEWQTLIGEIYQLLDFSCRLDSFEIHGNTQHHMLEFSVTVHELNLLMDRKEKETFKRKLIYENNQWRVFLGRSNLKPTIDKFERLVALKGKKHKIRLRLMRNQGIDNISGVYVKKAFLEKLEDENNRFKRYQRQYTVICCSYAADSQKETVDIGHKLNKLIRANIRNLDTLCQWDKNTWFILCPETENSGAELVIEKLSVESQKSNIIGLTWQFSEQRYPSIKELIESLINP